MITEKDRIDIGKRSCIFWMRDKIKNTTFYKKRKAGRHARLSCLL